MLVTNVSLRPPRAGIAANILEAIEATDATATGQLVLATLVDDPANVGDLVDAYFGEIMLEAASASDVVDGGLTYDAAVDEAATVAEVLDAVIIGAPAADPYFSNVKLLLGFEGADASTGAPGMTDESPVARGNATVNQTAQIDTAQFKFGASSLFLDGNSDYVSFADSADWDFGTGQFTLEGFFRFTSAVVSNNALLAQWPGGWAFFFSSGKLIFRPGSGSDVTSTFGPPTLNQWYHFAFDRDASNVARIYVDGVMVVKTTSYTANITGGSAPLSVGSLLPGFSGFDVWGHIDEVRITKGVARYGSDAGYTVPAAAFPRA